MNTPFLPLPETERTRHAWFGFVLACTMLLSVMFACALPFAALAALGALMLPRKTLIGFMLAAWGVNQLVGFSFMHYPLDASTLMWGAVLGVAVVAAGALAHAVVTACRLRMSAFPLSLLALAAGIVGFQAVLLVANLTPLGSISEFAWAIKRDILLMDVAAFSLLFAATRVASSAGMFTTNHAA